MCQHFSRGSFMTFSQLWREDERRCYEYASAGLSVARANMLLGESRDENLEVRTLKKSVKRVAVGSILADCKTTRSMYNGMADAKSICVR